MKLKMLAITVVLLLIGLSVYAKESTGEYKVIIFKTQTDTAGAKRPATSKSVNDKIVTAWMSYKGDESYVFAIVKSNASTASIVDQRTILSLTKDEETLFSKEMEIVQDECDYLNGVKTRPSDLVTR